MWIGDCFASLRSTPYRKSQRKDVPSLKLFSVDKSLSSLSNILGDDLPEKWDPLPQEKLVDRKALIQFRLVSFYLYFFQVDFQNSFSSTFWRLTITLLSSLSSLCHISSLL
jgi:hypothetical protein